MVKHSLNFSLQLFFRLRIINMQPYRVQCGYFALIITCCPYIDVITKTCRSIIRAFNIKPLIYLRKNKCLFDIICHVIAGLRRTLCYFSSNIGFSVSTFKRKCPRGDTKIHSIAQYCLIISRSIRITCNIRINRNCNDAETVKAEFCI